mmetsp:Transcript_31981/g.77653  ORF Transcript_31981/g.77653 Transcript_31981/m.77653 type:complete len:700 (-) Transcript_31981:277-2376(-)
MASSPPTSESPNEINQSALSATEFTYSGESIIKDDDDAGNHITKVPAEVHKLLVRPTATSLPNRFCEKRHALHEVVMLEQEEGDEANENSVVRKATNANNSTSACRLKTIGDYAFAECISLPRLSIPWTVETIGKNAFARCKQLVEVNLACCSSFSQLKYVGFCAFYQCTALIQIHIPSTVEEIEGHAFHGCRSLKEVKLLAIEQKEKEEVKPGSLVIGPSVFLDCSSLEKIKIPSSLDKLPKSCFHTCSALKEISLPEGLQKIKANAFINCISLEYAKIPSTVEMIQRDAFKGCKTLEAVDFGNKQKPSMLKEMEWEAFMDCISLRKVKIPNTLTVIKSSVFFGCTALVDVEISEGVKEIQHSAFGNCNALQAVILPQSVELIGIRAFASCPRLVTVEIPPTNMSPKFRIRKDAFVHCKAMVNVSLPRSLTEEYKIHGPDNSFGGGWGENGFHGCTWLEQQYGTDLAPFLTGEISRYGGGEDYYYPIHKLCYHSSATSVETLRRAIQSEQEEAKQDDIMDAIVDSFGMTPFHVLLTAGKRRVDLLEVLLEAYPSYILGWEDVTGKKAIDYCFLGWNWTIESIYMLQLCLRSYVNRRLAIWGGLEAWDTDLTAMVNEILSEDNNERQQELWRATFAIFQGYEQVEGITVLELGLWKRELLERNNGELAQDVAEREVYRARCGSSFVIPNVVSFLEIGGS